MPLAFFGTKGTGQPDCEKPFGALDQPHIVQLAGIVVNDDQQITESFQAIVRPFGWRIPYDSEIAGITYEHACDVGISEKLAVAMLLDLIGEHTRVCHSISFDNLLMRIAIKRYCPEEAHCAWIKGLYESTAVPARKAMRQIAFPTLDEACFHFTGARLPPDRSALEDVHACKDLYYAMKAQMVTN